MEGSWQIDGEKVGAADGRDRHSRQMKFIVDGRGRWNTKIEES